MGYLVYAVYPVLIALLLWKSKLYKKGEYNEEYMDISCTKALLGFFAICIIMHHISQKMWAQIQSPESLRNALHPFRGTGYLFVAFFFFCSGYGLMKSSLGKEDYHKGFLKKRFLPLIITFIVTDSAFQFARIAKGVQGFPANTYSWFVFVIAVLYIGFYLCIRFLKDKAMLGIIIFSVIWCVICRLIYFDTYWYNSVLAFPMGAFVAKHYEGVTKRLQSKYPIYLIVTLVVTGFFTFFGLSGMRIYNMLGTTLGIEGSMQVQTLLQLVAAVSFSLLIMMISMKLKVGNKALSFLGGMTLEIYLVHTLFVEMFCKQFIGSDRKFYYIADPFLYLIVVVALTIPAAFAVSLVRTKFVPFVKDKPYTAWAIKVLRKTAMVAGVLLATAIAYYSITSHVTSAREKSNVEQYKAENITMTEVDGKSMSAYITGEGERTVLLLGDATDPAPSLTMRPLADALGDNYKVIVPDLFGRGFSDSTKKARTSENIADELYDLVGKQNGGKPVVLISFETSGIIAETYINKYRNNVEVFVGIDMATSDILSAYSDNPNMTKEEVYYAVKCSGKRSRCFSKLLNLTGFVRMELISYSDAFARGVMSDHFNIIGEKFISESGNNESIEEQAYMFMDGRALKDFKLPEDLPGLILTYEYSNKDMNPKPYDLYAKLISNSDIQEVSYIAGNIYFIFYQPETIDKMVDEFLGESN
ncbi:MAG: acyltransferase family protein [Eubacterium sp.]|nr:acyltransferase family protein [Eubacterium sp.]